jgi:hypothetical protein
LRMDFNCHALFRLMSSEPFRFGLSVSVKNGGDLTAWRDLVKHDQLGILGAIAGMSAVGRSGRGFTQRVKRVRLGDSVGESPTGTTGSVVLPFDGRNSAPSES